MRIRLLMLAVSTTLAMAGCASPPLQPQFQKNSVWQVLWTRSPARSIVLQAITFTSPTYPAVRLILEKEGMILLQMDLTRRHVVVTGPICHWNGPPQKAPDFLQPWIAFALHGKNIPMEKFQLREIRQKGQLIVIAPNGENILQATRQFSKQ